jgi:hypothetical protein
LPPAATASSAISRIAPTTERSTDLRCDRRSEADGSTSSATSADAPVGGDDWPVVEDVFVDEGVVFSESPAGELPGVSAYAIPGAFAIAAPTPNVTASAPTRPMCLA